ARPEATRLRALRRGRLAGVRRPRRGPGFRVRDESLRAAMAESPQSSPDRGRLRLTAMSTAEKIRDPQRLRQQVLDLAPWYFDIEVTEGLRTGAYVDAPERPGTTRIDVRIVDLMDGTMTPGEAFVPTDRA